MKILNLFLEKRNSKVSTEKVFKYLGYLFRMLWLRFLKRNIFFEGIAYIGPNCEIKIRNKGKLILGDKVEFNKGVTIECYGELKIGRNTFIAHYCTLSADELVEIGENCLIAEMVSIRDNEHKIDLSNVPIQMQGQAINPVKIGNNVWIGAKATITKGVTIGNNSIIGANAVVTKDIPADSVAVGIPARVIKKRA